MSEMGGDIDAGRLSMDAYVDTAGMTRGLQRRIDAEMRAIKARIKAEIDTSSIVAEAKAAAKAASAAAKVRVQADADTARAEAQIDTAARDRTATIEARANTSRAEAQIDAAARDRTTTITVAANTSGLSGLGTALMQAGKIPAIAGGIYTLGAAAVQAAGGLFSMAAAGSQAVSVLAALPNLAGIAAQGIGALVIGFHGVGEAIGALGKQQAAAATDTQAMGQAHQAAARAVDSARRAVGDAARGIADARRGVQDAARGIADAQRAVAEAERGVADARRSLGEAVHQAAEDARQSAAAIADAERRVRETQAASRQAQDDLNQARADAVEYIQDLRRELKASANDETNAADRLKNAQEALADVNFNAASTEEERRNAQIAVREAQDALAEARDKHADLATEVAKANKTGVEGTDIMIRARQAAARAAAAEQDAERALAEARHNAAEQQRTDAARVAAAQRAVVDAHRNVADAERGVADAHRAMEAAQRRVADAQRSYADAQRNLNQAQQDAAAVGQKVSTSVAAVQTAMDNLSPAAQRFARFIYGLKPRWEALRDAVQEALLPPIQRGITAALPLLDTLQAGLVDTATRIGRFVENVGHDLGSADFQFDVASIMGSNNRALGDFLPALRNLLHVLTDIAVVAGPTLVEPFAKWVRTITAGWREAAHLNRESGAMAGFFERAGARAAQLARIVGNVTSALFGMGKAAIPAGSDLLTSFEETTAGWAEFANSDAGQQKMQQFFDAVRPVTQEIGRLVANLGEFLAKAGGSDASPVLAFFKTLNFLVQGLSNLASIGNGAGGQVFGALMALAGVGGALAFVSGILLKMAGNIALIGRATGITKLVGALLGTGRAAGVANSAMGLLKFAVTGAIRGFTTLLLASGRMVASLTAQAALWTANAARTVASTAAQVAASVAAKAMAAAQWLVNAALTANPIGIIIGLLVAFGVALVVLYKKNQRFRAIVQAVWAAIRRGIAFAWTNIIKPTFRAFVAGLRTVGGWMRWLNDKVVQPIWKAIRAGIQRAWTGFIKPTFENFKRGLRVVGAVVRELWNKYVKPRWTDIRNIIRNSWNNVISPIFERLKTGVGKVATAFDNAKTAIVNAWKNLREKLKKPIKASIGLFNEWVIGKFNWLSKKLNGPTIQPISTKGLAEGGTVPGRSPNSKADNIPIWATAREFMVRQTSAEKMRRRQPGLLEYINAHGEVPARYAVEGALGYAKGGLIRAGNAVRDGVQRLAGGGTVMDGKRLSVVAARQIRLAEKLYHINLRIMQGGYGGSHIAASGSSHNYPGVADVSPGSIFVEKILRKVGFAAWARNIGGRSSVGSGAHVHAVSLLDPGDRGSPQVYGSWAHHGNGLSGYGNDPAPHYPWIPNLRKLLGNIPTTDLGGGGGGGFSLPSFLSTLGSKIAGAVKAPAKWLLGKAKGAIGGMTKRFGDSPLARMLAGGTRKLLGTAGARVKGLFNKAKAKYESSAGGLIGGKIGGLIGSIKHALGNHMSPGRAAAAARGSMPKGWSWPALNSVVMGESGWRWNADNPTSSAYGIPQALPGSKMASAGSDWHDNALTQIKWMFGYIRNRYGNSQGALAFRNAHGWYDAGGPLYPGSTLAVNRTGKTETVFTNDNMVELGRDLQKAAIALRTTVRGDRTGGGLDKAALVENLHITGRPEEIPNMLRDANYELRKIRLGGVYARGSS